MDGETAVSVLGMPVLLRAEGTSLLLDLRGNGLPTVVHWGADLGALDDDACARVCDASVPAIPSNSVDEPRLVTLLPQRAMGYSGHAAAQGHASDGRWSALFAVTGADLRTTEAASTLTLRAHDHVSGVRLTSVLALSRDGVVTLTHALTNDGSTDYQVLRLPTVLPVPARATELLDLTGRHMKERIPQRLPFGHGAWVREQHRGKTGHDAPLVLTAGTPAFGSRSGEVWAVHLAWSGNGSTFAERTPEGWSCLGGTELLEPGELMLAPGASYSTPVLHAAWSDCGTDGASERFVASVRSRASHPTTPRPVVLNTWEAVYFNHDLATLARLADVGAEVGVELFVLDDGWFGSRRSDAAGLGDWHVSADVWPEGLHPLVDHVRARGMRFGLWVEPEMVNPDSDLARSHPEWLLAHEHRLPPTARNQQVLDVANPEVFDHLLERLDALVGEYDVDYLKWDHNRDVVDAAHLTHEGRVPGVHAQTASVYRLLDTLRARHPGLEIETCAGGGGRIDLGILERTDRVWASDSNDPLERQSIQRWTTYLLPPELVGCHVGPEVAHTTGRAASLDFRAGTAVFGHLGIEWDITRISTAEVARLSQWVAFYKEHRHLLHSGNAVNLDVPDASARVHGVVSRDGERALFAYVQLDTPTEAPPVPFRLAGLEDDATYSVRVVPPGDAPLVIGGRPGWFDRGAVLPGSSLQEVGLPVPPLGPQQLFLVEVART